MWWVRVTWDFAHFSCSWVMSLLTCLWSHIPRRPGPYPAPIWPLSETTLSPKPSSQWLRPHCPVADSRVVCGLSAWILKKICFCFPWACFLLLTGPPAHSLGDAQLLLLCSHIQHTDYLVLPGPVLGTSAREEHETRTQSEPCRGPWFTVPRPDCPPALCQF